jgi:hypothetical protein
MNTHHSHQRATTQAFLLGASLGLLMATVAGSRPAALGRATRLDLWQKLLARRFGAVEAALLAARVQTRFEALHAQRPSFARRALRLHLDHNLLPGLALYQVLRETSGGSEAALAQWDELVGAAEGSPAQKTFPLLGRVPGGFALLRVFTRALMKHGFPEDGWTFHWVEDNPQRIAFNIERCFYLTVLAYYGAPELTEHFCRLDDLAAEKLPPSIRWERTTTLGRGGSVCDFCWTYEPRQKGAHG